MISRFFLALNFYCICNFQLNLLLSDNDIDGEALLSLTERATKQLIPSIGPRMRFLKVLEKFKSNGEGYDTV